LPARSSCVALLCTIYEIQWVDGRAICGLCRRFGADEALKCFKTRTSARVSCPQYSSRAFSILPRSTASTVPRISDSSLSRRTHGLVLILAAFENHVALQAIPTAFPALVNPAVRALAIAKRWWLTLQYRCAPFLWNICLHGNKCSTGSLNKKLFCVPVSDFICCLVAVALLHRGSQTFIRSPFSC
jgi:hypothetical protein